MQIDFGPIITAMITPFMKGDKQKIDFNAAKKIAKHLINNGSDSIVITGTTGESPTLTHDEEIELLLCLKDLIKQEGSSAKIIFGAGSNCTKTAIKMSQLAEQNGADGLLMVTPYYNKPTQNGLIEHYSQIAQSTKLPIILYNVPSRTNISLSAQSIIHLALKHANIHSLKEASTNIDIISQIRSQLSSERFSIYSGDDSLTLPMMAVGARGVISVASHLVGREMQEMIFEFSRGEIQSALIIHQKLFPLFDNLFTEPNPTCIKYAMSYLGFCSGELREPLVPLSLDKRAGLEELLKGLMVFCG
jgi:4-hydroxy-tetrahydrodipicolinate synthase